MDLDPAGRPATRTDTGPTGMLSAQWVYDADAVSGQPQGFSAGRPVAVSYSSAGSGPAVRGENRFWYDAMGRVTRDRRCVDTVCHEMGYSYDPAGRLENLTYPDPGNPAGEQVQHTYDPAGRLRSVGGYLVVGAHAIDPGSAHGIDPAQGRRSTASYCFTRRTARPERHRSDE